MGFFDLFQSADINDGLRKMQSTDKAVLVDVRTREEYIDAHIPGSLNIPLDEIQKIKDMIPDNSTPLYVYCLSGGRSRQAVHFLKHSGYSNVTDIGGIHNYKGKTEKGV